VSRGSWVVSRESWVVDGGIGAILARWLVGAASTEAWRLNMCFNGRMRTKGLGGTLIGFGAVCVFCGFPMYFVLSPRDSVFVWYLATAMCWGGTVFAIIGAAFLVRGSSGYDEPS
jgi:hypothetical protein